jgi:hypothetical protein
MFKTIKTKIKSLFVKDNKPVKYCNPYVISIENNYNEEKEVILFDFNLNFNKPNFGNDKDIVITDVITGTTDGYGRLFAQSATKPFRIGKWRFKSDNEDNLKQEVSLERYDASGFSQRRPLLLSRLDDAYQCYKNIIESKATITVDSTTCIRMKLMPNSQMGITFYPIEIYGKLSSFSREYTKQNWIEKIKSFFKNLTNAN